MYADQAEEVRAKLEKELKGLQFFVAGIQDDPTNKIVVGVELRKNELVVMVLNPNTSEDWVVVFWVNGEQQQGEYFGDMYAATDYVVQKLKVMYG